MGQSRTGHVASIAALGGLDVRDDYKIEVSWYHEEARKVTYRDLLVACPCWKPLWRDWVWMTLAEKARERREVDAKTPPSPRANQAKPRMAIPFTVHGLVHIKDSYKSLLIYVLTPWVG